MPSLGTGEGRPLKRLVSWLVVLSVTLAIWAPVVWAQGTPADIRGHWAEEDVVFLHDKGILDWLPDGAFRPGADISRAEFTVWMCRAFGIEPIADTTFSDMTGRLEKGLVEAAARLGLVRGVAEARFAPTDPITRASVATLLSRFFNLVDESPDGFPDVPSSHWAARSVSRTVKAGLFKGDAGGRFSPDSAITKAEAATVLARAVRELTPFRETGAGLASGDRPKWGGDVFNRRNSQHTGPSSIQVLQALPISSLAVVGTGDSAGVYVQAEDPVLAGGLFIGSSDGLLALVDGGGGSEAWNGLPGRLVTSPVLARRSQGAVAYLAVQEPAADGFNVYSAVYAIPVEALSGQADWTKSSLWTPFPVNGAVTGLTVGSDSALYVATDSGYLYALEAPAVSGAAKVRWALGPGALGTGLTAPTLGLDGTIYVGSQDGKLDAVSRAGEVKWADPIPGPIISCPAVGTDGLVYVGAGDGTVRALFPGGRESWKAKLGAAPVSSGPALGSDGSLYVGCSDGYLYSLTLAGSVRWKKDLGANVTAVTVDAGGTAYAGELSGGLLALAPADGGAKWQFDPAILPTSWTSRFGPLSIVQPAIAGGAVIAGDGSLWYRSGGWLWHLGQ